MTFIAHTENAAGIPHLLSDHLRGVGNLAREFASVANPEMAEAAEWAGLRHDNGPKRFLEGPRALRKVNIEFYEAIRSQT